MNDKSKLDLDSFYEVAQEETYQDGEIIIEEGTSGDWVYIIIEGKVEVSRTISGERYVLGVLGRGDVFGELAFLGVKKRTASTRAIGETKVGIVDRAFLDNEFNKMSSDFRAILVTMVQRYETMLERVQEFTSRKEKRVLKRLGLTFKDRESFVNAYSSDLSGGGLFVRTDNPLKQGEEFLLGLQLPGISETLNIKCKVIWARGKHDKQEGKPIGMGVWFSEMNEKDAQTLRLFMQGSRKNK